MDYLFVYGTLRYGVNHRNGRLLMEQADYIGEATVRGYLYDIGLYPGLVLSRGRGQRITGDIFRLRHPRQLLSILDEYEECAPGYARPQEYRRVKTLANLKNGGRVLAWVYEYRHPLRRHKRIIHGDYLRYKDRNPSDFSLSRGAD
ncbi:MAG: gamma-glutamylcyclotransferase family protein [Gammaproteobacteria bacterium]|nr:gamma-glutamylcyclotransferase family protein [Gammaproteobacteria bacterium]